MEAESETRTREEILTKSVEKLVNITRDQAQEITNLKNRLEVMEMKFRRFEGELHQQKTQISINAFHANAESDLADYLRGVRDEDLESINRGTHPEF